MALPLPLFHCRRCGAAAYADSATARADRQAFAVTDEGGRLCTQCGNVLLLIRQRKTSQRDELFVMYNANEACVAGTCPGCTMPR